MRSENTLPLADTARELTAAANTRPMLHLRTAEAIREAAAKGMSMAIMPYANVPDAVSTLFSKDLADRGYGAVYDAQATGPYGHATPVLMIFWDEGSDQRGIS